MREFITSLFGEMVILSKDSFIPQLMEIMLLVFLGLGLLLLVRAGGVYGMLRRMRRKFSETVISSSRSLGPFWHAYRMTFVNDLNGDYKTTSDAGEFFDPDRLVAEWLDLRWWYFAPNLFFLTGLVAMLMQLFHGLIGFDISTNDTIMESVKAGFMFIANGFICLMLGVVLSVAMHFIVRFLLATLRRETKRFIVALNSRFKISTMQERELHLADYAKTLTRVVNTLFAGGARPRTLTPGVLAKELLDETKKQNLKVGAYLDSSGMAALPQERLEALAYAIGNAVNNSLRPGMDNLAAAVKQLAQVQRQSDLSEMGGEIREQLRASREAVERLCMILETEQVHKPQPEFDELASVMLDTANRLQLCLRSLQSGRKTQGLTKPQEPRQ